MRANFISSWRYRILIFSFLSYCRCQAETFYLHVLSFNFFPLINAIGHCDESILSDFELNRSMFSNKPFSLLLVKLFWTYKRFSPNSDGMTLTQFADLWKNWLRYKPGSGVIGCANDWRKPGLWDWVPVKGRLPVKGGRRCWYANVTCRQRRKWEQIWVT